MLLGQGLLVQRMGKTRVIAETGAGQHGVATATMAAKFGYSVHDLHGRGGRGTAAAQRFLDGSNWVPQWYQSEMEPEY